MEKDQVLTKIAEIATGKSQQGKDLSRWAKDICLHIEINAPEWIWWNISPEQPTPEREEIARLALDWAVDSFRKIIHKRIDEHKGYLMDIIDCLYS